MMNEAKTKQAPSQALVIREARLQNRRLDKNAVDLMFRNHWTNVQTGQHGILELICQILREAKAVFPEFNETTENRSQYVNRAMLAPAIIAKVRESFGPERYPDQTILQYLSCESHNRGKIGSVQLKGFEDTTRTSKRPRKVFYLISE